MYYFTLSDLHYKDMAVTDQTDLYDSWEISEIEQIVRFCWSWQKSINGLRVNVRCRGYQDLEERKTDHLQCITLAGPVLGQSWPTVVQCGSAMVYCNSS